MRARDRVADLLTPLCHKPSASWCMRMQHGHLLTFATKPLDAIVPCEVALCGRSCTRLTRARSDLSVMLIILVKNSRVVRSVEGLLKSRSKRGCFRHALKIIRGAKEALEWMRGVNGIL